MSVENFAAVRPQDVLDFPQPRRGAVGMLGEGCVGPSQSAVAVTAATSAGLTGPGDLQVPRGHHRSSKMSHHGPLDGHRQSLGPGQQPVGGSPSLGSGRRAGGGHCPHRQHRHLLNTTYSCTEETAVHLHTSILHC